MRIPDWQYHELLERILTTGRRVHPIQGGYALKLVGRTLRYPLSNGFPLITERDLSGNMLRGALAEHIAFLHGAQTHEQLSAWGCKWWKRWVTKEQCKIFGLPEGDLGPGSYGAAWTRFPTSEGPPVNQVHNVIELLKKYPHLRTLRITNWIPQYAVPGPANARRVVVAPCHGDIHIHAYPETKELDIFHYQRSGDVPVGVVFNIAQYAAFGMMVAQVIGYTMHELVHVISDAHIYEEQIPCVEKLLERKPMPFPKLSLNPSVKDIFDFRPEHFTLSEYNPHPAMTIPTPT
ncbi:MAG: thymidylate synthase [Candidatus Campbellbacteria bacterium]